MLLVALVGFWPAMVWHGAAGWIGVGIWLGCLLILFIIIDAIIHDRRVREHNAWVSGKPGQSLRRSTTGGMQ